MTLRKRMLKLLRQIERGKRPAPWDNPLWPSSWYLWPPPHGLGGDVLLMKWHSLRDLAHREQVKAQRRRNSRHLRYD